MTRSLRTLLLAAVATTFAFVAATGYAQTPKDAGDVASIKKFSQGFTKIFSSKPATEQPAEPEEVKEVAENAANAPKADGKLLAPIPRNVGVVLRAASLKKLDATAEKFFEQTSGKQFSLLATLRLTDYRQVLGAIDQDAEVAIMAFCEAAPPQFVVALPVAEKNFKTFVNALGQATPKESRNVSIGSDGKTANITIALGEPTVVVAKQVSSQYVALTTSTAAYLLNEFSADNLVPNSAPILSASLVEPSLSVEATPLGLKELTEQDRPFWQEVTAILSELQETLKESALDANLVEIREYVRQNLLALRLDVSIDDYGVYVATKTIPRPGSTGEKRVASYKGLSPLNIEADRFFLVLPEVEAPLSGQNEIAPQLASTLPKPFNRLRFVEYSLNLPLESELAAESWQFFLEVDNAEEFVKEMIVPKAREVGAYIGSKQVEDVGSQIFGALAERRLDRQTGRNRQPRRLVDPNEAAARGAALGNLLGNAIGADSGEQMAMKKYKFDDYTMYISDLETYTRQMNLKRAEEKGEAAPQQGSDLIFSRDRPLLSALDVLMANVQNGDNFQNSLLRSANEKAEQVDNSPLFARKSNIIVLDKTHILVGLGNEDLLHYACNNWKSLGNSSIRYLSLTHEPTGVHNMQAIGKQIPDLAGSDFVSAIRVDLAEGQAYYRWIAQNYLPGAPQLNEATFPDDMPKALILSSVAGNEECTRVVAPLKTIEGAFKTYSGGQTPLQLILSAQANAKNASKADDEEEESEDLDDLFDE